MRFVFVSALASRAWGGSEELWSQTAIRLQQNGHQVAACVCWWPETPKPVSSLIEHGIEVFVRPSPHVRLPFRIWSELKQKAGINAPDRTLEWLIRQRPDLVVVSNGGNMDGLGFLEMCLDNSLPYVSVMQANAEFLWPPDIQADRLTRVYQGAEKAYFVSHYNRALFETQLATALPNSEVVRNPFNVRWEASPSRPDETKGLRMACIGRLEPNAKGQDLVFQALASSTWKSRSFSLSLFGSGPMENGLRKLAQKLAIDDRIRIFGHTPDIEQVWAQHHALVLASRHEGLPLVLVESMLCSRPAIITDVAGDGEMVEDGVSGFVAPAPTLDSVASALERAWEKRADWKTMGHAARQRAEALIPKDPIGRFCEKLIQSAENSAK